MKIKASIYLASIIFVPVCSLAENTAVTESKQIELSVNAVILDPVTVVGFRNYFGKYDKNILNIKRKLPGAESDLGIFIYRDSYVDELIKTARLKSDPNKLSSDQQKLLLHLTGDNSPPVNSN